MRARLLFSAKLKQKFSPDFAKVAKGRPCRWRRDAEVRTRSPASANTPKENETAAATAAAPPPPLSGGLKRKDELMNPFGLTRQKVPSRETRRKSRWWSGILDLRQVSFQVSPNRS